MGDESHDGFWLEEVNGNYETPVRKKRKYRTKKKEYQGWGSTSLIWFLESIGRDTSSEIAQGEVANIILEYVKQHGLFHKTKKKRIECDQNLHSLFGRKSISRLKINDLLESHFAKNSEESSDDFLFNSEDDENAFPETPRTTAHSERKIQPKKPVFEKPRGCFAAIVPANIKLVYLKRSLVEELLKDPETFGTKVVGSFIRTRRDPNDFLQKNSHQLLPVTVVKKSSEVNGEICLRAAGFIKDIRIQMLSDDNFTEEECEDLRQRVKDGLVKRPMIVDMEHRARVLHEDMTKHWIAAELILLQNLIDRANEKGWRRELDEYLHRREKLQTPDEQERLLRELPQVIDDDQESESTTPAVLDKTVENNIEEFCQGTCTKSSLVIEVPKAVANTKPDIADPVTQSNSPKPFPSLRGSPEVPQSRETAGHQSRGLSLQQPPVQQTDSAYENDMSTPAESHEAEMSQALPDIQIQSSQIQVIEVSSLSVRQLPEPQTDYAHNNGMSKPAEAHEMKISRALPNKQIQQSQLEVIDLSDGLPVQQPPQQQTYTADRNGPSMPAESHEAKISQTLPNKHIQIIELSDDDDDDENEKPSTKELVSTVLLDATIWYYKDPQGILQGPFSLTSLKRWSDAGYFPRNFRVWKSDNNQDGVLLVNILARFFPI